MHCIFPLQSLQGLCLTGRLRDPYSDGTFREVCRVFGAKRLPEIGGGLGRAIRNFRQAASEPDEIDVTPKGKKEDQDKKDA